VLLVDENLLLVKSLARWLARFGCAVSAAVTCSDAAASVGPFDCGVFDVELGAADGVALADSLLSAGTVSTVTFFCATNDGRVLRRAAELGPVVFKDARMLELIKTVRTQIQRARSAP
jgi:DNA-binding response OmpR family regulator